MSTVDENIEVVITPPVVKTKKVPVKLGTILTEHEYETLLGMLKSSDAENHTVAQKILNECDVQKSIYWIWKLSKNYPNRMVYLRTKASRAFVAETNLWRICNKDHTAIALHLEEKKWLTLEIYQRLKEGILQELSDRTRYSNFYNMSIEIKDNYREFDPDSVLTPLPIKH